MIRQKKTAILLFRCCGDGHGAFIDYVRNQRILHPDIDIDIRFYNLLNQKNLGFRYTQKDMEKKSVIIGIWGEIIDVPKK